METHHHTITPKLVTGKWARLQPGELYRPSRTYVREIPKVGRNEMCPCGSGRKYKKCHGDR